MGADGGLGSLLSCKVDNGGPRQGAAVAPVAILGLQPSAMVDHVARVDWTLLERISGDRGGSQQVVAEDLQHILNEVNAHIFPTLSDLSSVTTTAGGSVANTIRGLAAGFGVSSGIIGACGDDDQGHLFIQNLSSNGVDLSRIKMKKGPTGQCACLVDADGNRTMRPCLSNIAKIQASELKREEFVGSKWLVIRYAYFNMDILNTAINVAQLEGVSVSMDLASFEMVRDYKPQLISLLKTGKIDLCFANEDEARELTRGEALSGPEAALDFLASYCKWAVVTLGPKGCISKHNNEIVRIPAIGESHAADATGAGDLFASGFLYGLVNGLSLEDCCRIGSCSGGAVIRSLSGEVRQENWQWMYKQMKAMGISPPVLNLRK